MKDIANEKFGNLTAISLNHILKEKRKTYIKNIHFWNFKCECGKVIIRDKSSVKKSVKLNFMPSCGCLRGLKNEQASLNAFYRGYVYGAKKRELKFELTIDEFKDITSKECHYCGCPPIKERKGTPYLKGFYKGNGVDRLLNNTGYILGNCVPCCEICNFMKRSMDKKEFIDHISKIVDRS